MSDGDTLAYLLWRYADLGPGECINIRTIAAGKAANSFFRAPQDAAAFIATAGDGVNVYAGINQRTGEDGTKAGVRRCDILHADVDFKVYPDGRDGALAAINAFPLPPTVVIESGGGFYCLWRLATSVPTATPAEVARLESLMVRMYALLGGAGVDHVQDLSRVLRVPGTLNWKPEYDSPRPVAIFRFAPEIVYTLEMVEAAFPAPATAATPTATPTALRDRIPSPDDIRELLRFIPKHQDYDDWLRCLMAVHSAYPGPDGVALVEAWSPGTDGEVAGKFAGFQQGDGVSIGTLIHLAKRYGWQPTGERKAQDQPTAAPPWDLASVTTVAEAMPKGPVRLAWLRDRVPALVGLKTGERQAWRDGLAALGLAKSDFAALLKEADEVRKSQPPAAPSEGTDPASDTPAEDSAAARQRQRDELAAVAGPLLAAPDLLRRMRQTYEQAGLTGEASNALTLALAATARVTATPVSVVVKGPSGSGKSFLVERTLAFLPPDAHLDYTTVSPKFLAYDDSPLPHRIVVLMEAPGLGASATPSGETTAYIARSLISEGRIRTGTVETHGDEGGVEARTIDREGPAALFTTTCRARLDPELETRLLTLTIRDDPEQTRAILKTTARRFTGHAPVTVDYTAWRGLQGVLQLEAPWAVVIPFAGVLADHIPADAIRARRDFSKLLSLLQASAILHHRQRQRDAGGRVVADLADYRNVYRVCAASYSQTADGLTPQVQEAVEAVTALYEETTTTVTVEQARKRLKIDRSAAQRRISVALLNDWLLDESGGRPGKRKLLKPGEPLPIDQTALPDPELIAADFPSTVDWYDPLDDSVCVCSASPIFDAQVHRLAENNLPPEEKDAENLCKPPCTGHAQVAQVDLDSATFAQPVQTCANGLAQVGKPLYQSKTDLENGTCAPVHGVQALFGTAQTHVYASDAAHPSTTEYEEVRL